MLDKDYSHQTLSRINSLSKHIAADNVNDQSKAMASTSKAFAVIAGVGPGTGAAVARKFGLQYPVALLARNPDNYEPYVKEINDAGGKAIGISTDVSDASSIKSAFQRIEAEFGSAGCAAAVFNASGRFLRKSVLDLTEEEFTAGYQVSG